MSDIEMAIRAAIWLFITIKVLEVITYNPKDKWESGKRWEVEKQIADNAKIYKKIEKENLALESLNIQKEKLENEINKLEIESSIDFEKEADNNTKIKEIRLKIKHIQINIETKHNNIYNFNNELKWIY